MKSSLVHPRPREVPVCSGKSFNFKMGHTWMWILVLLLSSSATLGKYLTSLSLSFFLGKEEIVISMLRGHSSKIKYVKYWTHWLACSTSSINDMLLLQSKSWSYNTWETSFRCWRHQRKATGMQRSTNREPVGRAGERSKVHVMQDLM